MPAEQHRDVRPVQPEPTGTTGSAWAARPGGERDAYLRERQRTENFPVALRLLPRAPRTHLAALYDVARVIDDLGDRAPGDRTALLTAFHTDLLKIWAGGTPQAPVLRRLAATVAACGLSAAPFENLVRANLVDQTRTSYATYADLEAYCVLSANPVGRTVLEIFGASTPAAVALSDRVCTALQVIEHCQDVAEDHRAGRCYLPREDLDRFGVDPRTLDGTPASPGLRQVVEAQAGRAAAGLDAGLTLVAALHGWARVAVTGYVAGGRAALAGLRRAKWDVMSASPGVRRLDVITQAVAVLAGREVGR
jgi:squalene synthase HpnC